MDTDKEEFAPTPGIIWEVRVVVQKKSVFIHVHPWLKNRVPISDH
jgi:hypothetical protein